MNNTIAIAVGERDVCPHELIIVTEVRPEFLLPATSVQSEGRRALLYSCEGLIPLAHFGTLPVSSAGSPAGSIARSAPGTTPRTTPGTTSLGFLFDLLTGYIKCLLGARDMLLNTEKISSDPESGVFVLWDKALGISVKTIWGGDAVSGESEKVCRIASALSLQERTMGAKTSMERLIGTVQSQNPSLKKSLALAESARREWNQIAGSTGL